ncbi:NAD(P)H-binding protein [Nocardia sp. BSTN01]|uniref:NAD(P)H-binding protein n=1 Tax=Nocardia sp. BSTN01 TaxID=2783665 RepID=UPI00188EA141|nr:NAD(P)H-binding protein [Nocardia sp. BSTN01]MBF4997393.1 NAD(P)H-binding protein [Nocardia sp. BSTN01]
MTSFAVIGATGQLGRPTLSALTTAGVPGADVVAIGRNTAALEEIRGLGFRATAADMNDPASIESSLSGVSELLLISGSEVGKRLDQHKATIDAAVRAGVRRIVYTSVLNAADPGVLIAAEHIATEDHLKSSGLAFTILRNAWYTENHQQDFAAAVATGKIVSNLGDGRIATATRQDLAEAAAVTLAEIDKHDNTIYELSGDTAWNYAEFAAAAGEALGREIEYIAVDDDTYAQQLQSAGIDEQTAGFLVALNANLRAGALSLTTGDLRTLIGHPTTTLVDAVRQWSIDA